MKIPVYAEEKGGPGFPTVSPNMIRRYGAAGFRLDEGEETRGCPRLYRKTYTTDERPEEPKSYALLYGSLLHRALQITEEADVDPLGALEMAMEEFPGLPPEAFEEARDDLQRYMERGAAPRDRYGTLATEREVCVFLYEDEEHGPIWMRGILDWLGVDLDNPGVLHAVDYKSNRGRSAPEDVRGDVQMRFYDLLLYLGWSQVMDGMVPQIVMHLDEVKWDNGDIPVRYTDDERQAFRSWLIAVVRHILRDQQGLPVLNPGCAWCPVKDTCTAYASLPDVAKALTERKPEATATLDTQSQWRERAWQMKSLLEKACREIDARLDDEARSRHGLALTDHEWSLETKWGTRPDMRAIHERLGEKFYDLATITKTALVGASKDWPVSDQVSLLALLRRVPVGTEVKKKKRKR